MDAGQLAADRLALLRRVYYWMLEPGDNSLETKRQLVWDLTFAVALGGVPEEEKQRLRRVAAKLDREEWPPAGERWG